MTNYNNNNIVTSTTTTTTSNTATPTAFIPSNNSSNNISLNYKNHPSYILFISSLKSEYTQIKYDGCLQRYLKQFVPDYKQKVEWLRRNTESLLI